MSSVVGSNGYHNFSVVPLGNISNDVVISPNQSSLTPGVSTIFSWQPGATPLRLIQDLTLSMTLNNSDATAGHTILVSHPMALFDTITIKLNSIVIFQLLSRSQNWSVYSLLGEYETALSREDLISKLKTGGWNLCCILSRRALGDRSCYWRWKRRVERPHCL